jgi:signal transduction histidine kinase
LDPTQKSAPAPRWSKANIAALADWAASPLGAVDTWSPLLVCTARTALGSSFPTILLWGPKLVQVYNDAYRTTFMEGRHPAGMGQPTQECWPEVWHFNEPIYQRVMGGEPVYMEDQEYILLEGGEKRLHYLTLAFDPVEGDEPGVEGILISVLDVTRRVMAERENKVLLSNAQETAETLRTWFDHAPGFVAVLRGPQYVFEMANQAYYQLVGHREILGKPAFEALPDVREQGFEQLLDGVRTSGKAFIGRNQQLRVQREPGGPRVQVVIDLLYQPIVNKAGEVIGIFAQGHEVTEQHRALQALREANRQKDQFLATLAHELRNPLAPIRQAAMIAKAPQATESQRSWSMDMIERQVQHLSLLLDDLLDVARVSTGRLRLRKESVDLGAVVRAAVEAAQSAAGSKEHTLGFSVQPPALRVDADALRVEQILSNLLTNAIKYTDRNGRIVVEAGGTPEWAEVRVRDNGVGLEPENLEKIFEMFAQVNSVLERSEGGLGIGLALSRGLAELHGGTLTASSDGLGKGTEFLLRLPVGHHAEPGAGGAARPAHSANPGARSLLLVDDNVDAAESLATLLELDGHSVRVANTGASALELAEEMKPEVAIVDIGMPDMNGYEVAKRIRASAWGQKMTLIALTGWGQPEDRLRAQDAGFDHHCTKPVQLEQLMGLLRTPS